MSILPTKPLQIRRSELALKGSPMWLCEHVNTHHSHMQRGRLRSKFGHDTLRRRNQISRVLRKGSKWYKLKCLKLGEDSRAIPG